MLSTHVKFSSVLNLWLPPSLTHPISISMVSPSPSHSSVSFSHHPVAYLSFTSYHLFSSLSGLSTSRHPSPPPCLSRICSLTQLISLSPLPAVSTSYSWHSSPFTYLCPLSFILFASLHLAWEFSHSLCSHQNLFCILITCNAGWVVFTTIITMVYCCFVTFKIINWLSSFYLVLHDEITCNYRMLKRSITVLPKVMWQLFDALDFCGARR